MNRGGIGFLGGSNSRSYIVRGGLGGPKKRRTKGESIGVRANQDGGSNENNLE